MGVQHIVMNEEHIHSLNNNSTGLGEMINHSMNMLSPQELNITNTIIH